MDDTNPRVAQVLAGATRDLHVCMRPVPRLEDDTRTLKYDALSYVRIFQQIEYAYDTFRTAILNENSVSYRPTNIYDIGHNISIIMHADPYLFILKCYC